MNSYFYDQEFTKFNIDEIKAKISKLFDQICKKLQTAETKQLIFSLKSSYEEYNQVCNKLNCLQNDLNLLRQQSSSEVLSQVEDYINSLANSPIEFNRCFKLLDGEISIFNSQDIISLYDNKFIKQMLLDITIVLLMFTVSYLSSNIFISIPMAIMGVQFSNYKYTKFKKNNNDLLTKINLQVKKLKQEISICNTRCEYLNKVINKTKEHREHILLLVDILKKTAPKNHLYFSVASKQYLKALINNTKAFANSLNTEVL
jgi:hypothetical protein